MLKLRRAGMVSTKRLLEGIQPTPENALPEAHRFRGLYRKINQSKKRRNSTIH
jgi:hypothetical protein